MNRLWLATVLLITMIFVGSNALAATYTFQPIPLDMGDLNHSMFYGWYTGLEDVIGPGEVVTAAQMSIGNLWDASSDPDNMLYLHLLNSDPAPFLPQPFAYYTTQNVTAWRDGSASRSDNWAGWGPEIAQYHAPTNWYERVNVTFAFDSSQVAVLNQLLLNDIDVILGFDPDCHFGNTGITFTVTTSVVPEPALLSLLGIGFIGVGAALFRRRSN